MAKKKPAPKQQKTGRPSLYTEALAAKICRRLAEGETLRSVCRDKAMPDKATVLRWLSDKKNADFRDQYAHARDMQADALFDEALEIPEWHFEVFLDQLGRVQIGRILEAAKRRSPTLRSGQVHAQGINNHVLGNDIRIVSGDLFKRA